MIIFTYCTDNITHAVVITIVDHSVVNNVPIYAAHFVYILRCAQGCERSCNVREVD
jgi:hypothetical protein